jgi:DNA-directed RNA polymerase subunit E'
LYKKYTISDTFKLPPEQFGNNLEEVAAEVLQRKYEGLIDKEMGVVVAIFNVRDISDGQIYPGDPSTHHDVRFDAVMFMPTVDEIVNGEVSELVEFGTFVRIGPMEGLVHVSQIANDFLSFDKKVPAFTSKKSGKSIKKGDAVIAKVSTVSMKKTVKDSKLALTMKPDGLGKIEWIATAGKVRREGGERKGGSRARK